MTTDFEHRLAARKRGVERTLEQLLPADDPADPQPSRTVIAAMRYAALGAGKRLRPIVALAAYEACGGADGAADVPAAALELIHTYSLVHDDLPAMDDDDLRRGRPTVHRVFGEATAILAGDALLTLAFEGLAAHPTGTARAERRAEAVRVVARCAGFAGLVGGQTVDLEAEGRPVDGTRLDWIHRHKTGLLFAACAEIGALHAGADASARRALSSYGESLGLAFQIADDLLDCSGTAESLGKTPGKDARAGKATYPALHGMQFSLRRQEELVSQALEALSDEGLLTAELHELARRLVRRTR